MGGAAGGAEHQTNNVSKKTKTRKTKPRKTKPFFFSVNSEVEVSTDEEGFKGSFYIATVLDSPHPPSSSNTKSQIGHTAAVSNVVYVEYRSLLADDDSSQPLREYIDVSFVRPPPPEDPPGLSFELDDVVDAFYRDGWWTGVITAYVDDSDFVVTFQDPPDEIQFAGSELRIHREWVGGSWVRPEKQRTAGLMFGAGRKVEIAFDKEEFLDVWFPATVLQGLDNGSFLVVYQQQGVGEDEELFKVTVDHLHIRPSPPHLRDKNFNLLEKVDAFFDFGWWSGLITKELAECRYSVFFKHTNKVREFSHSELRAHMEWKDGKWYSATQDVVSKHVSFTETAVLHGDTSTVEGGSEERGPCALNLMETQIDQTTPFVGKQFDVATSLKKKIKRTNLDSDDTHSQSTKKLKEGSASDAQSRLNTYNSLAPSKEIVIGANSSTIGHSGPSTAEEPVLSDQIFGKTEDPSHGKQLRTKREKGDGSNIPITGSVRKKRKLTQALPQVNSARKTGEATAKQIVKKDLSFPIVIGLECNELRNAAKKPPQFSTPKSPNLNGGQVQQLSAVSSSSNMKGSEMFIQKRKRGRPPKIQQNSPVVLAPVNQQNEGAVSNQMTPGDSMRNELGSPKTPGIESNRNEGPVPVKEQLNLTGEKNFLNGAQKPNKLIISNKAKLASKSLARASKKQHKKSSTGRRGRGGKRRTISLNKEPSTQDSLDASQEKADQDLQKDSTMISSEVAADKLPDSMADDQPLSSWFEGMHPSSNADCSAAAMGRTVEQQSSQASEVKNHVLGAPPVDANRNNPPGDSQSLPFVKKSPLWETIDKMEVFQMIPQKPHFRPLRVCSETFREGSAIGNMVTFSTVVEKTLRLQFDNPRSDFQGCLQTLIDLESHGFDVEAVRARLMRMLMIKDKQEELEEQAKQVRDKIEEHHVAKKKIDEEVEEIDKQIRELQEKRSQVMSTKEARDSEIAALESTVNGTKEELEKTRAQFDAVVSAPWVSGRQ